MAHPSLNFVRNVNKQIMIPEGHTIEDIKKREQIIRDFYREWKKKSISRQCEMLNFCPYAWRRCIKVENSLSKTSYNEREDYLLSPIRKTFMKSFRSPSRTPWVSEVS